MLLDQDFEFFLCLFLFVLHFNHFNLLVLLVGLHALDQYLDFLRLGVQLALHVSVQISHLCNGFVFGFHLDSVLLLLLSDLGHFHLHKLKHIVLILDLISKL